MWRVWICAGVALSPVILSLLGWRAWRRSPEARWHRAAKQLDELTQAWIHLNWEMEETTSAVHRFHEEFKREERGLRKGM